MGLSKAPQAQLAASPAPVQPIIAVTLVSGRRGAHAQHHGLPTLNGRSAAVLRPLAKIERRVARAARSSIAILSMLVAAVCACVVPTLSRILLVLCFSPLLVTVAGQGFACEWQPVYHILIGAMSMVQRPAVD